ncbi:MAG: hypothetical protein FJX25_05865 [Alphaproteobacteria bacterium]|nr:hypothetical protein [Alphaproteobacteria bacterium]
MDKSDVALLVAALSMLGTLASAFYMRASVKYEVAKSRRQEPLIEHEQSKQLLHIWRDKIPPQLTGAYTGWFATTFTITNIEAARGIRLVSISTKSGKEFAERAALILKGKDGKEQAVEPARAPRVSQISLNWVVRPNNGSCKVMLIAPEGLRLSDIHVEWRWLDEDS